jgi:secreted PhoX family phosphatase
VLYAARFNADGTGEWLALEHGKNGLTAANGFASQADVLVKTRQSADRVGATPMDRPEWGAVHPVTREVYMTLSNNSARGRDKQPGPDAANPRANNVFGHIIRWREDGDDVAATRFRWDLFALGGVPQNADPAKRGRFKGDAFGCPDGLWFDRRGVLWADRHLADRARRAISRRSGTTRCSPPTLPRASPAVRRAEGCEVTGSRRRPTTVRRSEHPAPGENGDQRSGSPAANSNWPDFDPNGRPRSATVVIRRKDGGEIGT